jgi:DNA gyrase subunit B
LRLDCWCTFAEGVGCDPMFYKAPAKLLDCTADRPVAERELFIVEGDSASNAIGSLRDLSCQAVMPMQGKPLNTWKATKNKIAQNEFFTALSQSIGAGWGDTFELDKVRYGRIILVFDPDADGIHGGMLVLMYFYRWMTALLDAGRIYMVHPPLFEITAPGMNELVCAVSDEEANSRLQKVQESGHRDAVKKRFRGLASMSGPVLRRYCLESKSRHAFRMSAKDAEAAIQVFCPKG